MTQNGRATEGTGQPQTEPDPSLFAPPPGYMLEEQVTTTKPVVPDAAQSPLPHGAVA
jgi:hypothetical protein